MSTATLFEKAARLPVLSDGRRTIVIGDHATYQIINDSCSCLAARYHSICSHVLASCTNRIMRAEKDEIDLLISNRKALTASQLRQASGSPELSPCPYCHREITIGRSKIHRPYGECHMYRVNCGCATWIFDRVAECAQYVTALVSSDHTYLARAYLMSKKVGGYADVA